MKAKRHGGGIASIESARSICRKFVANINTPSPAMREFGKTGGYQHSFLREVREAERSIAGLMANKTISSDLYFDVVRLARFAEHHFDGGFEELKRNASTPSMSAVQASF